MFRSKKKQAAKSSGQDGVNPVFLVCPACGSEEVRRSSIHRFMERVRSWRGKRPYLCLNCFHRFTRSSKMTLKRDVDGEAKG